MEGRGAQGTPESPRRPRAGAARGRPLDLLRAHAARRLGVVLDDGGDQHAAALPQGRPRDLPPASSYRVGDVVLYRSPILHRPVLHRILVIQHGRYFFKGENNDFVDPGWVTRDQLVGKLWIHVPRAGLVVSWFGKPLHSAAIAGLAVLMLVLGGGAGAVDAEARGGSRA